MGCGSSNGSACSGSVVPAANGTLLQLHSHRGASVEPEAAAAAAAAAEEPQREQLPTYQDIGPGQGQAAGLVLAFEIPLESPPGPRRPPRRLQRLEDAPPPPSERLTHKLLDERQEAADERRSQILSQRVQSAQQRVSTRRPRDSPGGACDACDACEEASD